MSIADFYRSLGAMPAGSATESEIVAAEQRLNGKLPETLRKWFLEANGFAGEAATLSWRFKSLARLHTVVGYFSGVDFLKITNVRSPRAKPRISSARNYAIFCDCLINLPYYATNIAPEDPHFGEVIWANEEEPADAVLAAASFDEFARHLFTHPEDELIILEPPAS